MLATCQPTPTLPARLYADRDVYAAEVKAIHNCAWQVLCHECELPEPGSYVALDLLGRRAVAVRGEDGAVRVFHNVCRHRAHHLVEPGAGTCKNALRCHYHGWTYHFDGRLRTVAIPRSLGNVDQGTLGLHPVDSEIWMGFVFFRFEAIGPSVAERMAPYAAELAHYRLQDVRPLTADWANEQAADWKAVWDNYLEGYHFATGHPGLTSLSRPSYEEETLDDLRVARLSQELRSEPPRLWSSRAYAAVLPEMEHLPPDMRRRWTYVYLYPSVALDLFPEGMDYFHIVPTGPGRAVARSRFYGLPDERRGTRLARWVNQRLNTQVQIEDEALILSVQRGLETGAYDTGWLTAKEDTVRAFQAWVREDLAASDALAA
ncbi:MAG: aromatic ring-hydroxylating dioxygenase subunit alpha [Geminicoccaceae bacterium]